MRRYSLKDVPRLKRKAQVIFNHWIVLRDRQCQYRDPTGKQCDKKYPLYRLEASHFFSEGAYQSVRYDSQNADALCHAHHAGNTSIGWEFRKQGEYKDFKISQLGYDGYEELEHRARAKGKYYIQWNVKNLQAIIEKYKTTEDDQRKLY